jgi:Tol biopolymer transport system component
VANQTNGDTQVFERDFPTGTTALVSATPSGTSGNSYSWGPVISAEGRFVAFTSYATDLVANQTNGDTQVFERDLTTGTTTLVSVTPAGNGGNGYSSDPAMSANGRFVSFTSSSSDLVANDNNGNDDVFVRDLKSDTTTLVSATPNGASGNGYSYGAVISANGRYVAFTSYATDLVANTTNGDSQVFERDLKTGTTTLVSVTPAGNGGNGYSNGPVMSADGLFVAFTSYASDLVPGDYNGASDVFGYRLAQSSGDNGDNSGNGGSAPSFAPAMVVFGQAAQGPLAPPHRPAQRPQAAPNRDQPPGGSVAKRALVLPQSGDAFERAVTELPHWANLDDPFLDDVAAALPESSCKRVAGGAAPQAVGFLVEAP